MPKARILLQVMPAVLIISLLSTMLAFSFAAMMVHTTQPTLLPNMVMAMLFTGAVSALLIAWKGSLVGVIAAPLSGAAAMYADIFQANHSAPDEVWLLLLLGGVMTAGILYVLGTLKLSRLIRYLPLPVLAGFLAGVGWLFIKGGLVLAGLKGLQLSYLSSSSLWVALSFSLALWVLSKRFRPAKLLPFAMLVGGAVMVFLAPYLDSQGSWFFKLEASGDLPLTGFNWLKNGIPATDWLSLPWAALITLVAVSVLSLLLQATSIELLIKKDLQLDHELKLAGSLNLLTAFAGGGIGTLSLSQTSMVQEMNASHRVTGVLIALMLLLMIFIHEYLVRWLPIPLVAGLLVFQGMQFINQWLITSGNRFPRADQFVIAVIFIVIIFQGFLGGVLVGLLLTVLLFIREYSRLQAIHLNTNLVGVSSGVEHTWQEQIWLKEQADRVRVYQLRGFLFFGTANTLTEQIKHDVEAKQGNIEALILDFNRVSNADSSTGNSLLRLMQFCDTQNIRVHIAGLKPAIQHRLTAAGLVFRPSAAKGVIHLASYVEAALELLENQLLQELQLDEQSPVQATLQHSLMLEEQEITQLLGYFSQETYADGDWVLSQGHYERVLYIIAAGQVDVGLLDPKTASWVRFKKMRPGTLLGEMGLYQNEPRSASARAVGSTNVLSLTHSRLIEMEANDPKLAIAFHRFVLLIQSERLRDSNRRVYSLLQD